MRKDLKSREEWDAFMKWWHENYRPENSKIDLALAAWDAGYAFSHSTSGTPDTAETLSAREKAVYNKGLEAGIGEKAAYDIRAQALQLALSSGLSGEETSDAIVKRAETFLSYLKGETKDEA